uniref:Uncharacterized protein n=1 Tax=Brassica oleracea TaxID=3712 RepID=A0A3P6F1V6_BRAOL|nr:unnamed protein product [Brassica oleracea]
MSGVHASRHTGLSYADRMYCDTSCFYVLSCMELLHARLHLLLVLTLNRSSHLELLGRFARFRLW